MIELEPELDTSGASQAPKASSSATGDEAVKAKAVVVDVNSKSLTYDQDRDVYIATGAVHVVISEQNSELFADQLIYDQNQSLLIAEGHVVIHKNGEKTVGTYAKIDLTRQSALINDIATTVDQVRIKAQQAMVANEYQVFENGRLILTKSMLASAMGKKPEKKELDPKTGKQQKASGKGTKLKPGEKEQGKTAAKKQNAQATQSANADSAYDPFAISSLSSLSKIDPLASSIDNENKLEETVSLENQGKDDWENEFLHIKAKEINVYRWEDGYAKVDIKKPSLYAGRFKVATLSNAQFSQDPFSEEVEYLGPDIGYDPDYGGAYYGPGWDFRLGNGSLRFSPFASYGGGGRRQRGQQRQRNGQGQVGPGIGGIVHYRGDNTRVDLAYNTNVGQPVLYAERSLWDKKTRLIGSINEDYVNGFMGFERPGFGVMLADARRIKEWGNWRLDTFSSAGVFKDDFFPNNNTADFIDYDTSGDPTTAGRIQFQAQLANSKPLFQVGNWLSGGFRAQVAGAGYTTGDMIGIIRGGPTLSMRYKDRWRTSLRYFLAQTAGESPFFFDQYYYGRQQLGVTNQIKVNDYLTLGLNSQMSLQRDNATNALFTGNQFFMLVGPKAVKFNIAYDVVRQRSYFGLTFMPGKNGKPVDYDTLRVFSPDDYMPEETNHSASAGTVPSVTEPPAAAEE